VSEAWTYDGFGAVASYTVQTSDGTVEYAMSGVGIGTPITRDSLGRITSMQELVNGATHTWSIGYDARGRLETVTRDGTTTTYDYDPNGNLTTVNGAPFGTFDAQDRMVSFTPPGGDVWTLAYTNNGDLTAKASSAQSYAFNYDLSSNLRSVQVSGATSAELDYVIDGMNRRIGKAVTAGSGLIQEGLLYDEQRRVVAELDAANNVVSTFVYGLKSNVPDYMVRGGTTYRIVSDWRGDVRLVVDTTKTGAAAVVEQIDYDEWGNVTNLVDPACTLGGTELCFQPFGFAGGVWDVTTGIVRFGAWDYDPQARRWTQKDPIRFDGDTNIYAYGGNDPVNGIDPSGEFYDPTCGIPGYPPCPPPQTPRQLCMSACQELAASLVQYYGQECIALYGEDQSCPVGGKSNLQQCLEQYQTVFDKDSLICLAANHCASLPGP
jgi:RHS repeat-associated protein